MIISETIVEQQSANVENAIGTVLRYGYYGAIKTKIDDGGLQKVWIIVVIETMWNGINCELMLQHQIERFNCFRQGCEIS